MKVNKKYILIGCILLLLCCLGNSIYYYSKILKEPLFIKNYYDVPQGMNSFNMYYIQNLNSQDKVESIIFPEVGQDAICFTENDRNSDNIYYKLKCLTVNLYDGALNQSPEKYRNKVLTKAQVKFSNGKTMNVNLGKIYLYSDEIHSNDLYCQSQSSSTDNTGNFSYKANQDMGIMNISSEFDYEMKDILQIYVNGKKLSSIDFPIVLLKDDTIDINYKFDYKQKPMMRNYSYFFGLKILTLDLQGNKGIVRSFINSNFQSPEDFDIDTLKKESE